MAYKSLIQRNVLAAFKKVDDLLVDLVITQTEKVFDFSKGSAIDLTSNVLTVRGLKKEIVNNGVTTVTFQMPSSLVPNIQMYDTVTEASSITWRIIKPCISDGFITTINVVIATL